MKKKIVYILVVIPTLLFIVGSATINGNIEIVAENNIKSTLTGMPTVYEAGNSIGIKTTFTATTSLPVTPFYLHLSSSYGNTILSQNIQGKELSFEVPNFITKKSGWVQWSIWDTEKQLHTGAFEIIPNKNHEKISEAYVGPPSIITGGDDYTMIVITPTDVFDNLLPNTTAITIKEQKQDATISASLTSKDRIVWKRVFSPKQSGRIFMSASLDQSTTKEMSVDVYANQPTNFTIEATQIHPFADGNQQLKLQSSILKDRFGNIVTDGTLVHFNGTDESTGNALHATGTTINGIAQASILYPNNKTTWVFQGILPGISETPPISISFKSILTDFNVQFSNNNRTVVVGPFTSFMNQIIPDGTLVVLSNNEAQQPLKKTTENGYVRFHLSPDFYNKGTVALKIEALNISKKYIKTLQ